MNNDAYLRRINRELRSVERDVFARLRPLLVMSVVAIRRLIVLNVPDEGLSRNLAYQAIRPLLEEALVSFNDTFLSELGKELERLQSITLGMAYDRLPTTSYVQLEFLTAEQWIDEVRVFGGWSLREYFRRRSPSQFMKEILRLVDRTVQRGLLQGLPTEEIARQIVPEVVNRGGSPSLTIRRGTILNAIRNRVEGTIAQAIWTVATHSERQVWTEEDVKQWIWSAILDEKTCPICTPLDGQLEDDRDDFVFQPPVHPNCVLGDTPVAAGGVIAATRALYSGDIVTVRTESGRQFSVTAQHPVLTVGGWRKAQELCNGLDLISHCERIPSSLDLPDLDHVPPTAAQVFEAFCASAGVTTDVVPSTPMQFHGDGAAMEGDIQVVWAQRPLQLNPPSELLQVSPEFDGIGADAQLLSVTGFGPTDLLFLWMNAAANGLVSLASECRSLLRGEGFMAEPHSFAARVRSHPCLLEPVYDYSPAAAQALSDALDALPGLVRRDQIVDVQVETAHQVPVYDLTTLSGIYSMGQVLGHNCRCRILPYTLT